jgi:tetratricopeptide (TPR) repeat protein
MTGDALVDGPNAIANGPPRDRVLWQYRTASAALRQGNFDVAKQYLDEGLAAIQGIYGKDEEARKSRGYFQKEARKTFLGEPYERSMAYIYRGMIYWRDGELDNARACFRSAQFEDSDTQEKKYSGDWVLPDYLEGLVNVKLGGDGSESLKRAQGNAKGILLPPLNPEANALFFIEFGRGPEKYATGEYGEQLRFRVTGSPGAAAELKVDTLTIPVAPTDNVGFQATTRGGRVMDHVLNNKAQFKSATDTAGNAALIAGGILAAGGHGSHSAADEVGLGLMLAGLASKIISSATLAEADTRAWDTLPNYVSVALLKLSPGKHTATVQFRNNSNQGLSPSSKTISFTIEPGHEKVVFISDQSATPQEQ